MKRNEEQLRARMQQMVDDEILTRPRRWMYLSYVGEDDKFRGAIYIEAHGMASAVAKANLLGISPGGQVVGLDIPKDIPLPPPEYRERLLTKAELDVINPGQMATIGEIEAELKAKENDGKK